MVRHASMFSQLLTVFDRIKWIGSLSRSRGLFVPLSAILSQRASHLTKPTGKSEKS
jgi:hypothetical protein